MTRRAFAVVYKFEVTRSVTKLRFWVAALLVPAVTAGVLALLAVNASARDADEVPEIDFVYVDESNSIDPDVAAAHGGTPVEGIEKGSALVDAGDTEAMLVFPRDLVAAPIDVIGQDRGLIANADYTSLAQRLIIESAEARLESPALGSLVRGEVAVQLRTVIDGAPSPGLAGAVVPLAFVAIFLLVLLLLSNQMLNSTLEEKENRVTEMLAVDVSPTTVVTAKIAGLFTLGLIQMALLAAPLAIAALFFPDLLALPRFDLSEIVLIPERIAIGLVILALGFVLFSATLVAIGAAMPSAKDAGGFFTVTIMLVFAPIYVVQAIISGIESPLVTTFTYFPYTASVTAMLRNAVGELPLDEAVVVIAILAFFATLAVVLAARLFRYGSLAFTSRVSLRSLLRDSPGSQ